MIKMIKKFLANRKRMQEVEIMRLSSMLWADRGYMIIRTETIGGQTYIVSDMGQRWKLNAADNQKEKGGKID